MEDSLSAYTKGDTVAGERFYSEVKLCARVVKGIGGSLNINASDLYGNYYNKVWSSGLQGFGGRWMFKSLHKRLMRSEGQRILEIGAGSGEALKFISPTPIWETYVALDQNCGLADPSLFESIKRGDFVDFGSINFVNARAESIPYPDNYFDAVISTCVLAHVTDPEKVFSELRRVTKSNGQIVILMPSDPGIMNRLIKVLITYPKMKRSGIKNPRLEYAREHRNAIGNLIALANHVFTSDKKFWKAIPLRLCSWNFNLFFLFDCKVIK